MKKLDLGSQLSKNEQKKVKGGATLQCYNPPGESWRQVVYNFSDCSNAAAYCAGAQGTTVDWCYN